MLGLKGLRLKFQFRISCFIPNCSKSFISLIFTSESEEVGRRINVLWAKFVDSEDF
jgi:hypothetical protein